MNLKRKRKNILLYNNYLRIITHAKDIRQEPVGSSEIQRCANTNTICTDNYPCTSKNNDQLGHIAMYCCVLSCTLIY